MSTGMSAGAGFLAIWSDVSADDETDYLHWLTREHAEERVSLPGFLGVRIFRALEAPRRHLIVYRLEDERALVSEAYLGRLNAPSPWSSRIMPKLQAFRRGGGRIVAEHGWGSGGEIAAARLAPDELAGAAEQLRALVSTDRLAATRLLEVDGARTDVQTAEKALRGGDAPFAGLALLEALDHPSLVNAASRWAASGLPAPELYRQFFTRDA